MSSFVYNVVNGNEESIAATFKFIHKNTNRISDIRETNADNQIVFDSDDADIDNQEAPFKSGDLGFLIAYNDNDEFAMIKIVGDGSDVYSGTIQLLSSFNPTTTIIVNNHLTNTEFTLNNTNSDEYRWTYNNVDHYHKQRYYGFNIFENVKIVEVMYKMEAENYTANNIYNIDTSGEYTFTVRVKNHYGQIATNTKTIKIFKHKPLLYITHDPMYPKSKEEYYINLRFEAQSDNFIESTLTHDTIELYSNTNLENTHTNTKQEFQENIIYNISYIWYNGFENITENENYTIQMLLSLSTLKLSATEPTHNEPSIHTIVPNITKGDGEFSKLKYEIYYSLPFTKVFTKVKQVVYTDIDELNLILNLINSGEYRVVGTLIDEFNGESKDSLLINAACGGSETVETLFHNIVFDRE